MADRLIHDLQLVYTVVRTVCDLYDGLDDDSQENGGAVGTHLLGLLTDFFLNCVKQDGELSTGFFSKCMFLQDDAACMLIMIKPTNVSH